MYYAQAGWINCIHTLPAACAIASAFSLVPDCKLPSATVRTSLCLGFTAGLVPSFCLRAFLEARALSLGGCFTAAGLPCTAVAADAGSGATFDADSVGFAATAPELSTSPSLRFFLSFRGARLTAGSTCSRVQVLGQLQQYGKRFDAAQTCCV